MRPFRPYLREWFPILVGPKGTHGDEIVKVGAMVHQISSLLRNLVVRATPRRMRPHAIAFLFPMLSRGRRGSSTSFHRVRRGLWLAIDSKLQADIPFLAFYEESRASRYVYPGPLLGALERRIAARYERGVVEVLPGDVVLDIGANIGEYSVVRQSIASSVIAIEADPTAWYCLSINSTFYPKILPVQAVLTSSGTTVDFYEAPRSADSPIVEPAKYDRRNRSASRTVDSIINELDCQVDVIKCDVEGAKPEVLAGATATLRNARAVMVDAGQERGGVDTVQAVSGILRAAGLEVRVEDFIVIGCRNHYHRSDEVAEGPPIGN